VFRELSARAGVHAFRFAERRLSVAALQAAMRPLLIARDAWRGATRAARPTGLPPDLAWAVGHSGVKPRPPESGYRNRLLQAIPDHLGEPKWMARCPMEGIGPVRAALDRGRPVILAFAHIGPSYLLRCWLRAAGLPAATLVRGKAGRRAPLMRFKDQFSPFPEVPTALHQDELRSVAGFLAAGRPLLVAVDVPAGRQMMVPFADGWNFRMATGAVRLAIRHRAALIPCSIVEEDIWRFRIRFGPPVPAACLREGANWAEAGACVSRSLIPHFQSAPGQCTRLLMRCFSVAGTASASRREGGATEKVAPRAGADM